MRYRPGGFDLADDLLQQGDVVPAQHRRDDLRATVVVDDRDGAVVLDAPLPSLRVGDGIRRWDVSTRPCSIDTSIAGMFNSVHTFSRHRTGQGLTSREDLCKLYTVQKGRTKRHHQHGLVTRD